MSAKILFITTLQNRAFSQVLSEVLLPYGKLDVTTWEHQPRIADYRFIFLDAGVLAELDTADSLSGLVSQLSKFYPQAPILVTTSSATWKRTREALLAGAVDYIRQTLDPDSLRYMIVPTLERYLLKSQHQEY